MSLTRWKAPAGQQNMAYWRADKVLNDRFVGKHPTLLPRDQLERLAATKGLTVTIHSAHEYGEYSSLIYSIDCLQDEISNI